MNFEDFLKSEASKIEKRQQELLSHLNPILKDFQKANLRGKKIRGALVQLGYEIAGGKKEDILDVAAAYEIFHTSILAHDDIIDQSPFRRGQPSLYKSVGVSQAITLADYGFFLAIKIISESNFPQKVKNEALKLFSKTMADTAIGQMLDIKKGDVLTIMKLKTAQYTFCGPLQIGAILAGAGNKLIRVLGEFGESLGIAFQIQDDILDGEEAVDYGRKEALKYVTNAKKLIPKLTGNAKISKVLQDMADYLVERNI